MANRAKFSPRSTASGFWTRRSNWRLAAVFLALGALNAGGFFWNCRLSPLFALFAAILRSPFLAAVGSYLLDALAEP